MNRLAVYSSFGSGLAAALVTLSGCGTEPEEPAFRTVSVSTRDISVSVEAAGVVEPITTVGVKSKASGEIFEMSVEIGDEVRRGGLLLRVDPRIPEANLRQAVADSVLVQAQLETAESQLRRAEQLHDTGAITDVEYEDARLAVASARASLVKAERSLEDARISAEDTEVRAPISGVVIDKRVEEGSVITSATSGASAGTLLLEMANLNTIQVRTLVDETDIRRVEPGLRVTVTVDAYPNRPFRGSVLKIEPQAEVSSNVTMFPVLVRIPNEEGLLRPGMNGEVDISIGDRRGVLAVPNTALRTFRDFVSAARVLGIEPQEARQQLVASRLDSNRSGALGAAMPAARGSDDTVEPADPGARERWRGMELPEGVTRDQMRAIMLKIRTEGAEALTGGDRALLDSVGFDDPPPLPEGMAPSDAAGNPAASRTRSSDPLATRYIVFVMRDSVPTPVWIRTGLTDGTYSEVLEGLTTTDTVLLLSGTGGTMSGSGGPGMGSGRGMGMGRGGGPPPR